jgi:hypothetical protein
LPNSPTKIIKPKGPWKPHKSPSSCHSRSFTQLSSSHLALQKIPRLRWFSQQSTVAQFGDFPASHVYRYHVWWRGYPSSATSDRELFAITPLKKIRKRPPWKTRTTKYHFQYIHEHSTIPWISHENSPWKITMSCFLGSYTEFPPHRAPTWRLSTPGAPENQKCLGNPWVFH